MLNNNTDVNGNRDARRLLAEFSDLAARDSIGYVATVAAKEPNIFSIGYSGTVELEKVAVEGLKKTLTSLEANILNRTLPERDQKLVDEGSYVCYNVTSSPLSFDFATWLMTMEMRRIKMGGKAPLKVGFWFGRDGKSGLTGMPDREQMLNKVCRPVIDLLGAKEDPKAVNGYNIDFFSYKHLVDDCKSGTPVPKLKTKTKLKLKPGYVTITLREASYWPHRNSKLDEWLRFAKYLEDKGERVIFVRDTAKADEPIKGFQTFPQAAKDLNIRMALYQGAKTNLFVANGPLTLALFSDVPWLKFFELDDQGAYNAGRSEYWRQCVGLDPDKLEQFPWSKPNQRIVWKPDYYTNLVTAWEETFPGKKNVKNSRRRTGR